MHHRRGVEGSRGAGRGCEGAGATDPDEAEHVARSIVSSRWKIKALTEVAKVLAATDPDRAERLAYAVTDEVWRPQALAVIAVVLAGYHPVGPQISLTEAIGNLL
jgi:hypothetical protein